MAKTYVTDIPDFLDDAGELKEMPAAARRMARFLGSITEAVTRVYPTVGHDMGLCCRKRSCRGSIQASLHTLDGKITWWCPICEQYGVISNWRGTQWDHTVAAASAKPRPVAKYTPKEGRYLAFIYYYTKLHRQAPAECDTETYFRVSRPTVHDMIEKLEKRGFISREPGKPRSIRLLLTRDQLPDLE
ncbi:MAG: MarR family transcriptional regulator [Thermoguttaceae bacterium]|jgi:repressor LexA